MKPPPAHGLINRVIALTLLLLVFSGSLGLGAVWARQGISSAANRNRALEAKLADVERRLDEVNAAVATAVTPRALKDQNEAMRLGLATPLETQVVRVAVSPELLLARKLNSEVFRQASAPGGAPVFRVLTASVP